jgi:hypothetical protein
VHRGGGVGRVGGQVFQFEDGGVEVVVEVDRRPLTHVHNPLAGHI